MGQQRFVTRQLDGGDAVLVAALEEELFPGDSWSATIVREQLKLPYTYFVGVFDSSWQSRKQTDMLARDIVSDDVVSDTLVSVDHGGVNAGGGGHDLSSAGYHNTCGTNGCERLIGYGALCFFAPEGDGADLITIGIVHDYRRKGLAWHILEQLLDEARRRNSRQILLEVRAGNVAAIAMYKKAGFRVIDKRKRYYRRPTEDALVMRLRLKGQ
ncbi:MAG: GNAT family N-acetyltransferase [Actinomycetaceae bacterium]|nr:GNAT family N-acetyltransferase [Actinomycetaceae bacterium]